MGVIIFKKHWILQPANSPPPISRMDKIDANSNTTSSAFQIVINYCSSKEDAYNLLCFKVETASANYPAPAVSLLHATIESDAINCSRKCKARCSKTRLKDRCLKYCKLCCAECKCVPSGTYGNKSECPCYMDKKSSQGKPKCP
ncbi:hypothetical protein ACH5RR_022245 [Cinchona calisaya]|uniref:Uncharacterized protein n=1 Tax=Cinchona calisaya TaxID=153742 RepID=A0ABD2ZC86_9GENT